MGGSRAEAGVCMSVCMFVSACRCVCDNIKTIKSFQQQQENHKNLLLFNSP